jgi:S-formylglutathione hydrolase FrmB
LALALRNPGTFRSASSMSGILDIVTHPTSWQLADRLGNIEQHRTHWEAHSARQLLLAEGADDLPILFVCGDTDRAAWEENQALHQALVASSRPHEWRHSSAGHSWSYWVSELPEHVGFAAEYLRGDGIRSKPSGGEESQSEEPELSAPAPGAPVLQPHEKKP